MNTGPYERMKEKDAEIYALRARVALLEKVAEGMKEAVNNSDWLAVTAALNAAKEGE
jgi:hypothetical protein